MVAESRTQSIQAFWSAGEHPDRLRNNGRHFPRKRGIPVLELEVRGEIRDRLMIAG